ncbi:MAG: DUF4384 domain-containing protein [Phycisphaerae bacterium]
MQRLFCVFLAALTGACTIPAPTMYVRHTPSPMQDPANRPKEEKNDPPTIGGICSHIARELSESLPRGESIAVLPSVDTSGAVRRIGVILADELERSLLDRGFRVRDRQHVDAILAESDLQLAFIEPSRASAVKACRIASANYLLISRITRSSGKLLISAKAVSAQNGSAEAATRMRSMPATGMESLMWYVRRPKRGKGGDLPPLAVKYQFVAAKGNDEVILADGATVRSRQNFKVRVEPNSDCYLYVLLYDSQGQASVLFPSPKTGLSHKARGGVSYEIPVGSKWFWFDDNPGTETFYIVGSYTPLCDLSGLLAKMQKAAVHKQLSVMSRQEIDKEITRGMVEKDAADYSPKGYTIRIRGVGGVKDIGWGPAADSSNQKMDNIIQGHATIVKKTTFNHR